MDETDQTPWTIQLQLSCGDQVVKTEIVEVCITPEANYAEVFRMAAAATGLLQLAVRGPAFEPVDDSPLSVYAAGLLEAVRVFKEYALHYRKDYNDNVHAVLGLRQVGEGDDKDAPGAEQGGGA